MKKFILLLIVPFFVLSQSKKELITLLEKVNNKIEIIQLELDEKNNKIETIQLELDEKNNKIETIRLELNEKNSEINNKNKILTIYNKYIGQVLFNDQVYFPPEGSGDNRCYVQSTKQLFTGYVYTGNFYIDPNGIKQFERTKYLDGVRQYKNFSLNEGNKIKQYLYKNGKRHGVQIEWEEDDLYITYRADNQKLYGWKISNNILEREKIYNYKNGGFKYTSYLDNGTINEQRCNDDSGNIIQCK